MDLTSKLLQEVTYWAPGTPDGYGGVTFDEPIQLMARWEDSQQMIFDQRGEEIVSKTKVFLQDDTEIGGYLYLGESVAADPRTVDQAFEIKARKNIPDLRLITTLKMAYL